MQSLSFSTFSTQQFSQQQIWEYSRSDKQSNGGLVHHRRRILLRETRIIYRDHHYHTTPSTSPTQLTPNQLTATVVCWTLNSTFPLLLLPSHNVSLLIVIHSTRVIPAKPPRYPAADLTTSFPFLPTPALYRRWKTLQHPFVRRWEYLQKHERQSILYCQPLCSSF